MNRCPILVLLCVLASMTCDLVQMSDRTNPANWIPDSSIVNPYLPGQ